MISFIAVLNIKIHNRSNSYLVVFLVTINLLVVTNYAATLSNNKYLIAIFMAHFMPLTALIGPSLYLYVRSVLSDDAKFNKSDLIHLVIPFLFFINTFRYDFLVSWDEKIILGFKIITENRKYIFNFKPLLFSGEIVVIIRLISVFTYIILSTILFFKHYNFKIDKQNTLIYRWLLILLSLNYVLNFSIVHYLFKIIYNWNFTNSIPLYSNYAYYISIASITLINLTLFFFPSILYGLPRMDYYIKARVKDVKPLTLNETEQKSNRDFEISEEKLQIIKSKIDAYSSSKPYLQLNFTLVNMAREINIPIHHLSYYFNEYRKVDFVNWRNQLRIEYVVHQMKSGLFDNLTLDAVSKQAGFKSRTTFINAFKQNVGTTPSEFINSIQ